MLRNQGIAENWKRIALTTLDTAKSLRESEDHRSCVSRAYYAAYQAATSVCISHGDAQNFPQGWNNPTHEQLPDLIGNNSDLTIRTRREVKRILSELREIRETADYRVNRTIDANVRKNALILASMLFERLEIFDDND